ncbi:MULTISPECIES: spore coat protein [Priestia]|uniref:spore coat protein n=1 Tax=Priestia TaxID=2800373 RepID=UPI0025B02D63|nr:spore coat protein [Priestia megaterium]MDN3233296.1 spore coat protein [Priestia megaterium]
MGEKKWRALDHCDFGDNGAVIDQDADAVSSIKQGSFEWIVVKDSEGVHVDTVDTQTAAQVQGLVTAVTGAILAGVVGNIQGKVIAQELNTILKTNQKNNQKTVIEGSKNVRVSTVDTDTAAQVQTVVTTLTAVLTAVLAGNISGG